MNHKTVIISLIIIAAIALVSCEDGEADDGEKVQLTGFCFDGALGSVIPIGGATIIVDTGAEDLIIATSEEDGTFEVSVPIDTPGDVTAVAKDRMANTYAQIYPGDEAMPLAFNMKYAKGHFYDTENITVEGEITNAPFGSIVVIYGGQGTFGTSNYNPTIELGASDTAPFTFDAVLWSDRQTLTYTAVALSNMGVPEAVEVFEVDITASDNVVIDFSEDALDEIIISINRPNLDGAPLAQLGMCCPKALTHISNATVEAGGGTQFALTGQSRTQVLMDSTIETTVPFRYFPGSTNMVFVKVGDHMFWPSSTSSEATPHATASVAVDENTTSLSVVVLDSPAIPNKNDFAPGGSVAWDPIEGASEYIFYPGRSWVIHSRDPNFSFPRFPDDFDQSLISLFGTWTAASRSTESTWADVVINWDTVANVKTSYTLGGSVSW